MSNYFNATEYDSLIFKIYSASHGCHNGFRLFEYFFLHERTKIALHDLLDFHLECSDLSSVRISRRHAHPVNGQSSLSYCSNVIVLIQWAKLTTHQPPLS